MDTDRDGMPDDWEKAHGLNPNDGSDAKNYNLSPDYTNLEIYLNSLVQSFVSGFRNNVLFQIS